jgi:hypothetical protein
MNTTVLIPGSLPDTAPRGARWAASAFAAVYRLFEGALKTAPQASTVEQEAAEARAYADQIAPMDPRFAADLYAAADRHEAQAGR